MSRKFNTITRWPNIHACPLDLECWCEWWLYGMPMRVHHKKRFWTIPGPLRWVSAYRNQVIWSGPVLTTEPNPTSSTTEEQPSPANPVSREA